VLLSLPVFLLHYINNIVLIYSSLIIISIVFGYLLYELANKINLGNKALVGVLAPILPFFSLSIATQILYGLHENLLVYQGKTVGTTVFSTNLPHPLISGLIIYLGFNAFIAFKLNKKDYLYYTLVPLIILVIWLIIKLILFVSL